MAHLITVYHRTSEANAAAIARDGFKDTTGTYLTVHEWTGVWVSDVPLDPQDYGRPESDGAVLISITIDPALIAEFEWIEDGKPTREWLVPAELLNSAEVRRLTEAEDEAATVARWTAPPDMR